MYRKRFVYYAYLPHYYSIYGIFEKLNLDHTQSYEPLPVRPLHGSEEGAPLLAL